MHSSVKKWGNSAAIRIPAAIMKATRLDLGDPVHVREEKGRIIVEPLRQKSYDLETLVQGITARNRHEPADFGEPMGGEAW